MSLQHLTAASGRQYEPRRGTCRPAAMRDWREANGDRFVRLVFSNEPIAQSGQPGDRVRRSLGA